VPNGVGLQRVATSRGFLYQIPTFPRVGHLGLPVAFSPRPSCTADSSAALRATAPVRSLVHAWPCSAPLQPLLLLPFPAPPLLVIFCAHRTFHHSLSYPISHFPPRFPNASLTALSPLWHICCLDTGFERLPLVCLPCCRYRWKRLDLYFPKCPKTLQFDNFNYLLHVVLHIQTHREQEWTTESTQYPSCIRLTLASPWPRPTATSDVYPCPILRKVGNKDCLARIARSIQA
jgi:hypothetical protein